MLCSLWVSYVHILIFFTWKSVPSTELVVYTTITRDNEKKNLKKIYYYRSSVSLITSQRGYPRPKIISAVETTALYYPRVRDIRPIPVLVERFYNSMRIGFYLHSGGKPDKKKTAAKAVRWQVAKTRSCNKSASHSSDDTSILTNCHWFWETFRRDWLLLRKAFYYWKHQKQQYRLNIMPHKQTKNPTKSNHIFVTTHTFAESYPTKVPVSHTPPHTLMHPPPHYTPSPTAQH